MNENHRILTFQNTVGQSISGRGGRMISANNVYRYRRDGATNDMDNLNIDHLFVLILKMKQNAHFLNDMNNFG